VQEPQGMDYSKNVHHLMLHEAQKGTACGREDYTFSEEKHTMRESRQAQAQGAH
jgi:hypothetical protein